MSQLANQHKTAYPEAIPPTNGTSAFAVFSLLVAALTLLLGVVLYLHPSPPTAAQE